MPLPREPLELRQRAEEFLGLGEADADVPRAIGFALLAIAGELATIRRDLHQQTKKR
jgi:hypothetical protein